MGKKTGGSFGIILTHLWANIAVQTGGTLEQTYTMLQESVKRHAQALQNSLDMISGTQLNNASNLIRALKKESGMSWNQFWRAMTLCKYTHAKITITLRREVRGRTIKTASAEVDVKLGEIDFSTDEGDEA